MKPNEIRDLSADEQASKLKELKEELFNLRFQHATGQLDNPMRIHRILLVSKLFNRRLIKELAVRS